MSTLSGQGNLNELTQPVNSVTENLTTADQQLNSQSSVPYVEVEAGSVAHSEYSSYKWELDFSVTSPNNDDIIQQMFLKLFNDDKLLNPELEFGLETGSMAQTEDMNPNWESSPTAMSSLGDGEGNPNANELPQQFNSPDNSQRDVEEEVGCFEPNPSHLDHADQASNGRIQKGREPREKPVEKAKSKLDQAGTSAEACIGKKRKAREPIILTKGQEVERKMKKREGDKKYRADIRMELNELRSMKPQYDRLMEIVSRFEGIDQMESYINHSNGMNSELLRLRRKEVEYDMFQQLIETELHRLGQMKSKYGGIEEMESMLDKFKELEAMSHRLELMKSKYGGIEKMESMLDKFKDMEAESHKLDQIKSKLGGIQETESIVDKFMEMEAELHKFDQIKLSFGGIDEIESRINRLKKIELQFEKHKQMVNQKELESFQAYPGSRQEESGSQSLELNGDSHVVSDQCGISLNSSAAVSGTTPDVQYSDVLVDQLVASLTDENVLSTLDLNSFKDLLEGERESVGKYQIPPSLVSTARDIFNVHGDITKKSKYSVHTVQTIFVLFCAAIKEMGDLSLEEFTEKIILKLRDPIMDAKRSEFDVEFAMKHLKTIVQGYFGLKARKDLDRLEQRMASLRADEEALRKELEKKSNEIKTEEAKQGDLTSKQCKICLESADKFLGKMVGIF